jgi:hypothetical protein
MAPDVLTGGFTFSVDQFSLGMLAYEALRGSRLERADRAAYCHRLRGDEGLEGLLALLLAGEASWRLPEMRCVAAIAQHRSMSGFEARPAGRRIAWRIGERPFAEAAVPGLQRFVHSLDAKTPAMLVRNRVVSLDDPRKSLFTCTTESVLSVNAELNEVWVQNDANLTLWVNGRRAATTTAELGALAPMTLQPEPGVLVLAQPGRPEVCVARRVGERIEVASLATPGPVAGLGLLSAEAAAVGGDANAAWAMAPGAGVAHRMAMAIDQVPLVFAN